MAGQSFENQVLQDQLEKAKETLSRLRCINGLTPTCCTIGKKCHWCWRQTHDIAIGKCSDPDGSSSKALYCTSEESDKAAKQSVGSRSASSYPSVSQRDLRRLHKQIDSLEESVRGPILSYVESMERRNIDMTEAIEAIRRQLVKQERVCPAMSVSSGNPGNGSEFQVNGSERENEDLKQRLRASHEAEQRYRVRAESLEKELELYREKLDKSEAKVKELFHRISSQSQSRNSIASNEVLLENQLRRQQQLTECYFKDSTSKDKELSFLTIEKYNLESEISSLITDLESVNQKRDETFLENTRLQTVLRQCHQRISGLEQQLKEYRSENKRLKSHMRGILEEERTRGEKNSENQSFQEKQIKELRKKCKKYEEHYISQKDCTKRLETERQDLLTKVKSLSSEYKSKLSECDSLKEENQRLSKDIKGVQMEASCSKMEYSNSRTFVESLRNELQEAKSSINFLQHSLQERKAIESKSNSKIAVLSNKEASMKERMENAERDRLLAGREIEKMKNQEVAFTKELQQMTKSVEASQKEAKTLGERCCALTTDLEVSKEKYFQLKKTNELLVLSKSDLERSRETADQELNLLKVNCEAIREANEKMSADLKAYKRIVVEKEDQLKKVELELAQVHKAKDKEFKELLKKDREVAFLKARVTSTERFGRFGSDRPSSRQSNSAVGQYDTENPSKDIEVYLERIVELESECKAQNTQIEELQKNQSQAKKDARRSDTLTQELAQQDEHIQTLKREMSRSKLIIEDLRSKEQQLGIIGEEKEMLRQEVVRLRAKVEQVTELKQVCEQKEEEMKALRRMSSEELDLEGKVSRLKDRCREKDEEIEELHQKVIALQVKIKDFMQQNSEAEEQMRNAKDKYSIEVAEKEKISQTLKTAETKSRALKENLEEVKNKNAALEKELLETKRCVSSLQSDKDGAEQKIEDFVVELQAKQEELEKLRKQVQKLEDAARIEEEEIKIGEDLPDGASTPLDNSLESSRLSFGRSGQTNAYERLEMLEEENIHLLNRQSELEDELDASEKLVEELKSALKTKRENVNELHGQLDAMKERMKLMEKTKMEMADENEQLQQQYLLAKQKTEDLKVASERYIDESDELEKALTAAEEKIEELERKLEEVSGKFASSEGQLQSMTERLARKEKELQVVEGHVDEQRKLCDGYKASAERQETLIEKLRVEKVSVEEAFLAMKLEAAKKEGTYKTNKEKLGELQAKFYETEDKYNTKMNELKKVSRENERLKRELNELESKMAELHSALKKKSSSETEKSSGVYNTKFLTLNTAVKDNSQNVEGLDTKLNLAQNKISTLEVELANDLRKFSLHRSSSDTSRRGFYSNDNQLSPNSYSQRRPRSYSQRLGDDRESSSPTSTVPIAKSSADLRGEEEYEKNSDFSIPKVEVNVENVGHTEIFADGTDQGKSTVLTGGGLSPGVDTALFEADPFLSSMVNELSGGIEGSGGLEGLAVRREGSIGGTEVSSGRMDGLSDGEGSAGGVKELSGGIEVSTGGMEGEIEELLDEMDFSLLRSDHASPQAKESVIKRKRSNINESFAREASKTFQKPSAKECRDHVNETVTSSCAFLLGDVTTTSPAAVSSENSNDVEELIYF